MGDPFFTIVADDEEPPLRPGYRALYVARLMSIYRGNSIAVKNRPYGMMNSDDGALILNERDNAYRPNRGECFKCGRTRVSQSHVSLCSGIVKNDESGAGRSYDAGDGYELQPLPSQDGREIGYIVGPSGSGKTVFMVNYIVEYMSMFDDRQVFIFTGASPKDPAYNPIMDNPRMSDRVVFATVTSEILNAELKEDGFANSLVVFDDTSAITDKKIKTVIDDFRSKLCYVGRHSNTSVLVTNHLECEFSDKKLKAVVTESHFVVVFPSQNSEQGLKRLLTTWCGVSVDILKRIKEVRSRWAYVKKSGTRYVMSERNAFII